MFALVPQGPYRLAGYSSGGIVAFEMARQLRARGHAVAFLGIFDQGPGEPEPTIAFGLRWVTEFLRNLPHWFAEDFRQSERGEMLGRVRSQGRLFAARIRHTLAGSETAGADIRDVVGAWRYPEESRQMLEAEYQELTSYVPQRYPGRIALFRARSGPLFRFYRSDMGWADLAAEGVDVRVVPGSHVTMLTEPHVRVVAEELRTRLAETPAWSDTAIGLGPGALNV
jgi:thioesterase domain-containing protein